MNTDQRIMDSQPPTPPRIPPAPRQRLGKGWIIGLSAVGAVVVTGFVLVVVAGFLLVRSGLQLVTDQVREDIQANPVILEQIGTIEEIELQIMASNLHPGDDVFVFKLTGSKDAGKLTAKVVTVDADTEQVNWGKLRVKSSGETWDLFPDQGPRPPAAD
ncbi:MAG: hypothetical protein GTO62_07805 [Planctomycetales bacterium]|nr:hypothetical protein [Planctomycetales bacterium]